MPASIVLVDDDRNILTSVSIALEAEGYKVRAYTEGAQALKGILEQPTDLAVLDIKMPGMDGLELLSRIRRSSALPVIFLTSKDEEIDEVLGLKMGADDYMRKPFSQRLLIERIKALAIRPGHVKSRDQLMDAAYGEHIYVDDRTIDSHIKRMRKKFRQVDPEFDAIETLYGVGYRYRET